jgi:hypothetical protein
VPREVLDHRLDRRRAEIVPGQAADAEADAQQREGERQGGDAVGGLKPGLELSLIDHAMRRFQPAPAMERDHDQARERHQERDAEHLARPAHDLARLQRRRHRGREQPDHDDAEEV